MNREAPKEDKENLILKIQEKAVEAGLRQAPEFFTAEDLEILEKILNETITQEELIAYGEMMKKELHEIQEITEKDDAEISPSERQAEHKKLQDRKLMFNLVVKLAGAVFAKRKT